MTEVLDPATLERLRTLARVSNNPVLLSHLIELFLEDTARRMAGLRQAVAQQNPQALRVLAHSIRGGAAIVGASEIVSKCNELEELQSAWTARIPAVVDELARAIERAQIALMEFLADVEPTKSSTS